MGTVHRYRGSAPLVVMAGGGEGGGGEEAAVGVGRLQEGACLGVLQFDAADVEDWVCTCPAAPASTRDPRGSSPWLISVAQHATSPWQLRSRVVEDWGICHLPNMAAALASGRGLGHIPPS